MIEPGWIFGSVGVITGAVGFIRGRQMNQRLVQIQTLIAARLVEHPEAAALRVAESPRGQVGEDLLSPVPNRYAGLKLVLRRYGRSNPVARRLKLVLRRYGRLNPVAGRVVRLNAPSEAPQSADRPEIDWVEFRRRLAELPDQQAAALQLWAEGASPTELGPAFGVTQNTMDKWLNDATTELSPVVRRIDLPSDGPE